jgi:hypothetical protein
MTPSLLLILVVLALATAVVAQLTSLSCDRADLDAAIIAVLSFDKDLNFASSSADANSPVCHPQVVRRGYGGNYNFPCVGDNDGSGARVGCSLHLKTYEFGLFKEPANSYVFLSFNGVNSGVVSTGPSFSVAFWLRLDTTSTASWSRRKFYSDSRISFGLTTEYGGVALYVNYFDTNSGGFFPSVRTWFVQNLNDFEYTEWNHYVLALSPEGITLMLNGVVAGHFSPQPGVSLVVSRWNMNTGAFLLLEVAYLGDSNRMNSQQNFAWGIGEMYVDEVYFLAGVASPRLARALMADRHGDASSDCAAVVCPPGNSLRGGGVNRKRITDSNVDPVAACCVANETCAGLTLPSAGAFTDKRPNSCPEMAGPPYSNVSADPHCLTGLRQCTFCECSRDAISCLVFSTRAIVPSAHYYASLPRYRFAEHGLRNLLSGNLFELRK